MNINVYIYIHILYVYIYIMLHIFPSMANPINSSPPQLEALGDSPPSSMGPGCSTPRPALPSATGAPRHRRASDFYRFFSPFMDVYGCDGM